MLALPTELQGITSQNIKIDNSYRPLIHKQWAFWSPCLDIYVQLQDLR
jgi:hypothetical protein